MPDYQFRSRARLPLQADAADIEAFLLAKDPTASRRWDDMGKDEHARAFTAARTAGTDIVDDLYFGLVDTIANRGTEEDFTKLVTPILKRKGWLEGDEGKIATRVALIYDTNLRVARASGRWSRYQASKVALPYVEAFTAEDERVRHPPHSKSDHTAFNGIVLPLDHPFVAEYWTPLGFRCRCGWRQLSRSQLARRKLGITSEADLASRKARIGPPLFSLVAPIGKQLGDMVTATNADLMPGMPPVDPERTQREGEAAWTATNADRAWDDLDRALAKLFGMERIEGRRPIPRTNIATPTPAPPPPPPPVPEPPAAPEFRSPINPDVTAETIKVEPRLALQKRLRAETAEAAKDPRYSPTKEFRDRTEKDFGNTTFAAGLDDEAASMIAALKPELDDLAKQIGIPPLRGLKTITGGKAMANQGDGVMGLNSTYFNAWASRVGGRGADDALKEITAQRAAIVEELAPYVERLRAIRTERNLLSMSDPRYRELYAEETETLKKYTGLRKKDEALWKKESVLKRRSGDAAPPSEWKPGDDPAKRPFTVDGYFADGVDKARTVLFHEFGHHVHQYLNKAGPRRAVGDPPLEKALGSLFTASMQARAGRLASKYSMQNSKEWFAENFAAYVMGRKDLVDELAVDLIERIFRRVY